MSPAHFQSLGNGVYCLDSGYYREQFTAAYLIVDGDEAALIDIGSNDSVPILLASISALGIKPEQIRYLIPTHVHLDHCGGAGELLKHLPNATVMIHPDGVEHLVEPQRLVAGTAAVYGMEFVEQYYGAITPISAQRIVATEDKQRILLGQRELEVLFTPGHAWHHHSIFDMQSGIMLVGDAMGVAYSNAPYNKRLWFPATPPSQFNPQVMKQSIDLQVKSGANSFGLGHYNLVENSTESVEQLKDKIDQYTGLAANAPQHNLESYMNQAMAELFATWLRELLGSDNIEQALKFHEPDVFLSAKGVTHWLTRQRSKQQVQATK